MEPKIPQRIAGFRRLAIQAGSQFHGSCEEGCRFLFNDVEIILLGELQIKTTLGLDDFTTADFICERRYSFADPLIFKLRRQHEGVGEETITKENAQSVTPLGICCGSLSANLGSIDDIIVHQSGHMDQFEDHGQLIVLICDLPGRSSGEEGQGRAYAFT